MTQRICFLLKVRKSLLAEYRKTHEAVWPEMQEALTNAGWSNYSLFLRDDGMLIGYLETDDFEASRERLAATDVNARWQAEMAPYFEELEGQRPDEGLTVLPRIFYLP